MKWNMKILFLFQVYFVKCNIYSQSFNLSEFFFLIKRAYFSLLRLKFTKTLYRDNVFENDNISLFMYFIWAIIYVWIFLLLFILLSSDPNVYLFSFKISIMFYINKCYVRNICPRKKFIFGYVKYNDTRGCM